MSLADFSGCLQGMPSLMSDVQALSVFPSTQKPGKAVLSLT